MTIVTFIGCDSPLSFSEEKKDYENADYFGQYVSTLHDSLGKKYHIKDFAFDVECIYEAKDLTKLVKEIVDSLGGFTSVNTKEGHDPKNEQYFSILTIQNKSYEFRTTSAGDYVDLDKIYPVLQQITTDLRPDYAFNFSNRDGGQIAYMIFARKTDLAQAVDEGYPCSLESGIWKLADGKWPHGTYSDIELNEIPDLQELKVKYHATLMELYEKGYNVPHLTIERLYIDDRYKEGQIHITIDGNPLPNTYNRTEGNTVRCFWDSWGILLAYTLIKHYNGKPSLTQKDQWTGKSLTVEEYLSKATAAFGMRKQ